MTVTVTAPQGAHIMGLVPDGMMTVTEAAAKVGKSKDTLVRWRKGRNGADPIYAPKHYMMVGELKVWLYDEEDIRAMKKIAKSIRPGRKPAA